jgi:hypothetical protein
MRFTPQSNEEVLCKARIYVQNRSLVFLQEHWLDASPKTEFEVFRAANLVEANTLRHKNRHQWFVSERLIRRLEKWRPGSLPPLWNCSCRNNSRLQKLLLDGWGDSFQQKNCPEYAGRRDRYWFDSPRSQVRLLPQWMGEAAKSGTRVDCWFTECSSSSMFLREHSEGTSMDRCGISACLCAQRLDEDSRRHKRRAPLPGMLGPRHPLQMLLQEHSGKLARQPSPLR